MMAKITNIEVEPHTLSSDGLLAALSWEDADGYRYHYWCGRDLGVREDTILYKNPGRGWDKDHPRYFEWTRHLNPEAKANAAMIREAQQFAWNRDLFEKAVAERRAATEETRRQQEEAARIHQIKEAGTELLDALELLANEAANVERVITDQDIDNFYPFKNAIAKAQNAIRKAKD